MIEQIIAFLQSLPPELVLCIEYLVCCLAILIMTRLAGRAGLVAYIALAVVIGNMQVLKTAHFAFLAHPVALGTILFSSSFVAVDILSEFYGQDNARQAIWIGFSAILLTTLLMILTISIKPADMSLEAHKAMSELFLPLPSLFFASLISYLASQHIDISIFQAVRRITSGKYLWLRTVISGAISALIDNIIFSSLAFIIFARNPVEMERLIYTYILGTLVFRVFIIIIQTPVIYLVRRSLLSSGLTQGLQETLGDSRRLEPKENNS